MVARSRLVSSLKDLSFVVLLLLIRNTQQELAAVICTTSGSKSRSKACESDSPNDAWLRFSGSLKVQKNIFTLAAISLVQASMFLEPDWVGAKRQGQ